MAELSLQTFDLEHAQKGRQTKSTCLDLRLGMIPCSLIPVIPRQYSKSRSHSGSALGIEGHSICTKWKHTPPVIATSTSKSRQRQVGLSSYYANLTRASDKVILMSSGRIWRWCDNLPNLSTIKVIAWTCSPCPDRSIGNSKSTWLRDNLLYLSLHKIAGGY